MKRSALVIGAVLLVGLGFAIGRRQAQAPDRVAATPPPRRVLYYRNPMDPTIRSETPAKDSMGMDYVPVYADEAAAPASEVAGRATVTIPEARRRLLGIQTAAVTRQSLARYIRTVGRVAVDERRVHHVHTKFDGYVEHLYVDFTGKFVKKGEPVLSIYSPDLVATEQEYLLAWRAQREMRDGLPEVAKGGAALLDAARQRLLFWGIRPEDIEYIEKTGEVRRTLDLYSEMTGYVTQKMAVHGMRVTPADSLFDISDLSHVWILADVYESDLASVRVGMSAEMAVTYLPGRKWRGAVTYIDPVVEEKTRTVKVRVEIDNPDGELKPDMFADVFLTSGAGSGLVVPESAVLSAGDRRIVFVDRDGGRLEPREVALGGRAAGGFEVLRGLAEGDRVVTSANFLVDSESSLQAALGPIGSPSPAAEHRH